MQFQSYTFVFVFLPLVFCLYSFTRTNVLSKWIIVISSLLFYGWQQPWFVVPMLFTGLLDYFVARRIADSSIPRTRLTLLLFSLALNLGLMSFFKYTGWITESLVALGTLTGFALVSAPIHVPLPPGVSFYTFESISYTVDVYKEEFKPRRQLLDYLAFLVFFPHLVAGPIRRASQLLPVLSSYRPAVTFEAASRALFMILFGLFLKLVLADNFGALAEQTLKFIDPTTHVMPAGLGLVFTYAFCFQIYCDFAAYSNIARGTARLFNVELANNFLTPYFSTGPSEFWTRWHISLSTWLRDYLYIPLGGNRGSRLQTFRNLMVTMFLAGLWHGAGVFFIIWGVYHGLLLILYRFLPIDDWLIRKLGRAGKLLAMVLFFNLVCIGWIFFRASPAQFLPIWGSILSAPGQVIANFQNWLPYLRDALNVGHTLRSYWPYLSDALHQGVGLWRTLGAIGGALVQHHVIDLMEMLPRVAAGSLNLNPAFSLFGWELFLLAVPLVVTDFIGYRRNCEFPETFASWYWPVRVLVIVLLIYGIELFGRREGNAFIYFAF
jgi:D-alanyl-lipoteichoic acid acyltransferase DltB (MBOAT superfamily)